MKFVRDDYEDRGLVRFTFRDLYHAECSVQTSSLATAEAIWFGCNRGTHVKGLFGEEVCCARMHLDREQVRDLLPILQRFADTGELALEEAIR